MELRHVRYFVAVADQLSFRAAAAKLHVSQPSLSAQIRQLEEEIGVRLLERDTHRVKVTLAGQRFLQGCRGILRSVEDNTWAAQSIAKGEAGMISVGFVSSLGLSLMPGVMRDYGRKFPNAELELVEMDSSQQIKALHDHQLDLGFIGLGLTSEKMSGLNVATVVEEQLYVVVPENHRLGVEARRFGRPLALSDLSAESFLFAARSTAPVFNPWLVVLCHEAGFQPNIRRETGQPVTVLNYVAAGLGISILPAQFCRLSVEGVTFIRLTQPAPRYRYSAAWSRHNRHPGIPHLVRVAQMAARKCQHTMPAVMPRRRRDTRA
jgi:DNA-binding transcriptional LysR family regulator